ncbi:MAG: DMT family transporter [Hyphomicrobiaceae bacterium]
MAAGGVGDGGTVRLWAVGALLAGAVALGSSPILVRLSELEPTATAFWRVAFAVPVMALVLMSPRLAGRRNEGGEAAKPISARDGLLLVCAGLLFAVDLLCLHWSLRYTSVANATLLLNTAPVFVALLSWLVFGERLNRLLVLGLAVAFAGVSLLVGGNAAPSDGRFLGDALGLMAGAGYGGYLVIVSRVRRRLATGLVIMVSAAFCALALLPAAAAMGESILARTATGWAVLVGLGVVTHAGGQGLVTYAFRHLPASSTSATLLLQPVTAALAAWLLFAEGLAPLQIAGGLAVLLGVLVCHRAR